jgi:gliding motility-associated-like protein
LAYANLEDCLSDTVGIEVSLFQTRLVDLPPDTVLCYRPDFIVAPDTLFESYQWSDGSTDSIFNPELESSLTVSLAATDFNGCRSFDIMIIEFADCTIQIPNVITPNGDGINDEWIIGLDRPLFFEVVIYNRWGLIVYESKDFSTFWNGTNYKSGELCSEGVYFYIISLSNFEGTLTKEAGDITLLQ